ncbi:hypothetical protein [Rhodocyclus tenuis]|uniref:Uncharacterized protein n=1 Tax=Rhodocyclus tenuis TaxID=1066 RepID=A0A840G1K8_RHOTE|nr:hypothetical protein [Rhodocyclus tenuis]MBB4245836.1 hypothetical protein [Rhodocyclus tenuis]
MKHDVLKNNIATLQKLRDVHHSQLDAGALAELDDVLQKLKRLAEEERPEIPLGELALRVLQIIDTVMTLVTNLTDLLR